MADTPSGITQIGAQLKEQYAPEIVNIIPQYAKFQSPEHGAKRAKIETNGKFFVVPIISQQPEGTTYPGTAGDGVTLEEAVPLSIIEAEINGYEQVNRVQTTYKALTTADSVPGKAFKSAVQLMMKSLKDVAYARNEMSAMFGQSNVGEIESVNTTDGGVTLDVVFTAASWIPAWWAGRKGGKFEAFQAAGTARASHGIVNTVTNSTRTVNFTEASTGSIAAWAATDVVFPKGASTNAATTWTESVGLYKQLTSTGTVFNLARSSYTQLLVGQSLAVSGILTKQKVLQGAQKCADAGCEKDLTLWVAPNTWADLAAEDMALRMFDSSYSSGKSASGSRAFEYQYDGGTITVKSHGYMKRGFAFLLPMEDVYWVGSTDVTFRMPGIPENELFYIVQGTNKVEFQCMSDKQIFLERPAHACVFTGITASS